MIRFEEILKITPKISSTLYSINLCSDSIGNLYYCIKETIYKYCFSTKEICFFHKVTMQGHYVIDIKLDLYDDICIDNAIHLIKINKNTAREIERQYYGDASPDRYYLYQKIIPIFNTINGITYKIPYCLNHRRSLQSIDKSTTNKYCRNLYFTYSCCPNFVQKYDCDTRQIVPFIEIPKQITKSDFYDYTKIILNEAEITLFVIYHYYELSTRILRINISSKKITFDETIENKIYFDLSRDIISTNRDTELIGSSQHESCLLKIILDDSFFKLKNDMKTLFEKSEKPTRENQILLYDQKIISTRLKKEHIYNLWNF